MHIDKILLYTENCFYEQTFNSVILEEKRFKVMEFSLIISN